MNKRLDLLKTGANYLAGSGVQNPAAETELLLSHVLNCPRFELYLNNFKVCPSREKYFWQLLSRRQEKFPLQYLTGSVEFMGLEFKTKPGVFIPRPETEILVENIINIASTEQSGFVFPKQQILDIGTGCGNIAVSLARYLRNADIFGCDISDSALRLAAENAGINQVKISLIKSDLFAAFSLKNLFSLIVSNPPYIPERQIAALGWELQHEPVSALEGGAEGLKYYRLLIDQAPDYLAAGGFLALELGDGQIGSVKRLFASQKKIRLFSVILDYNQIERVVIGQKI